MHNLDELAAQIGVAASHVGLREMRGTPTSKDGEAAPQESRLWAAEYAVLLLWPVQSYGTAQDLARAFKSAQNFLDLQLLEREEGGRQVDGYLVLALERKPDIELNAWILRTELDTRVCRKHVVIQEPASAGWTRVERITVLGLPPAPESAGSAQRPAHGGIEQQILTLLEDHSPQRAAAALLAEDES